MNLSARQLSDPELVGDVLHILRGTGIAPGRLSLEVTESMLLHETPTTKRIETLVRQGVLGEELGRELASSLSYFMLLRMRAQLRALKTGREAALTPVTYLVVGWLKRVEGVDVYDRDTNFTPFRARV